MNELENIKVGDLMVVHASYCDDCLRKVERVTKSQIVVSGTHYWKKNGLLVCRGDWRHDYIRRATEKDIEFFNKAEKKNCLHSSGKLLGVTCRSNPYKPSAM